MNWTWWQWIFAAYIAIGAAITMIAWLCGRKKAPGDAGTSEPEQRKIIDISILREAEKIKRKMRGERK